MTDKTWLNEAIDLAITRMRKVDEVVTDFPHITEKGQWKTTKDGVWTGGFWAGLLWLAYAHTQDPALRGRAEHYTDRLLPRRNDSANHDLGFMFVPSAVAGWRQTGRSDYHEAALDAARALAGQYNPRARYIPGWGFFGSEDWGGKVLIDTLMNLPFLVWAVEQGADRGLLDVVRNHVETSLQFLQRPDGSVYHRYQFDSATGTPIGGDTYQGLGPESSWTRGQGWALGGLAMLGTQLGEARYLRASERVADYFLSAMPESGIAPWDFHATGDAVPRDSSASAIAAFGLLRLHKATGSERYREASQALLQALHQHCANRGNDGGILLHATADLPHDLGVDESVMYGDYYYLKALLEHAAMQRHD